MRFSLASRVLASGMLLAIPGNAVMAQDFPSQPIRIYVGFSAGGGTDAIARVYADAVSRSLEVPVIVENRPGAHQLLAINPVLTADPDGYSLFMGVASSLASNPGTRSDLGYDPLVDFERIGLVARAPGIIFVNPQLGITTFDEFVDYAIAHPGELNYGSAGVGASNHMLTEYIMSQTGIDMQHIPYGADQEVVREVMAGNIDVAVTIAQFAAPMVESGDLVALAVVGAERLDRIPDVPLLKELSYEGLQNVDSYSFYGLVGPRGIPQDVVETLNAALNAASEDPALVERLRAMTFTTATSTPETFTAYLETEISRWRTLAEQVDLN